MILVLIAVIQVGSVIERDFFTHDRELLISKGVLFSDQHLDALKS